MWKMPLVYRVRCDNRSAECKEPRSWALCFIRSRSPCPAYSSNAELVPFSQRHVYAEIIHKYIDFPLSALYCKQSKRRFLLLWFEDLRFWGRFSVMLACNKSYLRARDLQPPVSGRAARPGHWSVSAHNPDSAQLSTLPWPHRIGVTVNS